MADTIVPTIVDMARDRGVEPDEKPTTVLAALKLLDEATSDQKKDKSKEKEA